jgi:hypothetical protein
LSARELTNVINHMYANIFFFDQDDGVTTADTQDDVWHRVQGSSPYGAGMFKTGLCC